MGNGRHTKGYHTPLAGDASGGTGYTWPPDLPFGPTLERARQLDQTAISMLYRRFLPIVYRYALAQVGAAPQAEDVTSETFYAMVDYRVDTRAGRVELHGVAAASRRTSAAALSRSARAPRDPAHTHRGCAALHRCG